MTRLPRYRITQATNALTGHPVLIRQPTLWGRLVQWWRRGR